MKSACAREHPKLPDCQTQCCQHHVTPGCKDSRIEKCVCDTFEGKSCCEDKWDEICVTMVDTLDCGTCIDEP